MSASTVIQRISHDHLGVKIGHKAAFYLWAACQNLLEQKGRIKAVHALQEAVDGRAGAVAEKAMKDAMSQVLLNIDWPRRGMVGEDDIDVFPSLMRDSMRRHGIRITSPDVSGLKRAA